VAAIERLRGTARKSYATFEAELRKQGCKVAGYRLMGAEGGYAEYCCKRLVDDWRVIATFEPGIAIVIAIGRHDSRTFYAELSKKFAIGAVGQGNLPQIAEDLAKGAIVSLTRDRLRIRELPIPPSDGS
jgi:hypothetical protein